MDHSKPTVKSFLVHADTLLACFTQFAHMRDLLILESPLTMVVCFFVVVDPQVGWVEVTLAYLAPLLVSFAWVGGHPCLLASAAPKVAEGLRRRGVWLSFDPVALAPCIGDDHWLFEVHDLEDISTDKIESFYEVSILYSYHLCSIVKVVLNRMRKIRKYQYFKGIFGRSLHFHYIWKPHSRTNYLPLWYSRRIRYLIRHPGPLPLSLSAYVCPSEEHNYPDTQTSESRSKPFSWQS